MCTPGTMIVLLSYCVGSGGNGCVYPATVCTDNNACTSDSCNPNTGCVFTNITCNDNSACTTDTCIPSAGCQYNPVNCDDRKYLFIYLHAYSLAHALEILAILLLDANTLPLIVTDASIL